MVIKNEKVLYTVTIIMVIMSNWRINEVENVLTLFEKLMKENFMVNF